MATMAVLGAANLKQAVEIFYISIAYINAALKFFFVYYNREQVQILWKTLYAPEFRIAVEEEHV